MTCGDKYLHAAKTIAGGTPADMAVASQGNQKAPPQCSRCGGFLRKDGGCTKCEGYTVQADASHILMQSVESGDVRAVGYDADLQLAVVERESGEIYLYRGVHSTAFARIKEAEDVGEAVKRYIDNGSHSYKKLGHVDQLAEPASHHTYPWMTGTFHDWRKAMSEGEIKQMSANVASMALNRLFYLATERPESVIIRQDDLAALSQLYSKADMSEMDNEHLERAYNSMWKMGNLTQKQELLTAVAQNHTAPANLTGIVAHEVAYGAGKIKHAAMLMDNPNFGIEGQRVLATSPKAEVRKTLAQSPRAAEVLLNDMVYDRNEQVALASGRNPNSPHAATFAKGKVSKIPDRETLRAIQKQGFSWRDLPRCGACGAWTKQNGVCNNKRCGGFGKQMAETRDWPPRRHTLNLGEDIPLPEARGMASSYSTELRYTSFREEWKQALAHKKYPDEWRKALPAAISTLAATGQWKAPNGEDVIWDSNVGLYRVDGIPVRANNAGEVVRTVFSLMDYRLSQAGEKPEQVLRYSQAYDSLVKSSLPEPDTTSWLKGKTITDADLPATTANMPKGWTPTDTYRQVDKYYLKDKGNVWANVYKQGSQRYQQLSDNDTFRLNSKTVTGLVKQLRRFTQKNQVARLFTEKIWAIPPDAVDRFGWDKGAWLGVDGHKMMMIAHDDNEVIPYKTCITPEAAPLIGDGEVTLGREQGTMAFKGKEGHLVEVGDNSGFTAFGNNGKEEDLINSLIPDFRQWDSYEITSNIPKELVALARKGEDRQSPIGRMEVTKNGDLEMVITQRQDGKTVDVGRHKIGKLSSNKKPRPGVLAGINLNYFNDVVGTKIRGGGWKFRINPQDSRKKVIIAQHDSGRAVAAVMPVTLKD